MPAKPGGTSEQSIPSSSGQHPCEGDTSPAQSQSPLCARTKHPADMLCVPELPPHHKLSPAECKGKCPPPHRAWKLLSHAQCTDGAPAAPTTTGPFTLTLSWLPLPEQALGSHTGCQLAATADAPRSHREKQGKNDAETDTRACSRGSVCTGLCSTGGNST